MSRLVDVALLTACLLGTSVWVGGYVAIGVVAYAASSTLEVDQRVRFFRRLGRTYLPVGVGALAVAIGTGLALARHLHRSALLTAAIATMALLLTCLAVAVAQARRLTLLRTCAIDAPDDSALAARVRDTAVAATLLRALLGILSAALVVQAACLAT